MALNPGEGERGVELIVLEFDGLLIGHRHYLHGVLGEQDGEAHIF